MNNIYLEKNLSKRNGYRALWRKDLQQGFIYFNTFFLNLDVVTANGIINPVMTMAFLGAI